MAPGNSFWALIYLSSILWGVYKKPIHNLTVIKASIVRPISYFGISIQSPACVILQKVFEYICFNYVANNHQITICGEAIIGLLIAEYSPTVQLANIQQLFAKKHEFCRIFSNFVMKFPIFLDFR